MKRRVAIRSGLVVVGAALLDSCRQRVGLVTGRRRVSYEAAFDRGLYNSLPAVEEAHRQLQALSFRTQLLRDGLDVIDSRAKTANLGLFLLHRHFPCPAGSIMLEQPLRLANGEWAYVTAPTQQSDAAAAYAPSRFMFVSRGQRTVLVPLEFSTDAAVLNHWREVADDPGMLGEIANLVEFHDARRLVGLAVIPREHEDATMVLLEDTFLRPPRSLVRWVPPKDADPALTIPTLFSGRRAAGCCTLMMYCEFFCRSSGEGGHTSSVQCRLEHIGCA